MPRFSRALFFAQWAHRHTWSVTARRALVLTLTLLCTLGTWVSMRPPVAEAATCTGNAVSCENLLPGTPASEWNIDGRGEDDLQGFATQMSTNAGSTVSFKIDTTATAFSIKIFRLGYYQGNGARQVAAINPNASLAHNQPACATDPATQIYDCGTWRVSASWPIPTTAVSGVYFALLQHTDTGRGSHIPFVVRNDGNTSQALFQTSDSTWQAYNTYGGSNFYYGGPNGRAFKLSYNRPFSTRDIGGGRDFLFANEYPMIRFLEQNGMDVSYVSGQDVAVDANLLPKHKVFMSVGHDEYWSKEARDHVTAARDAKVNLAFFGGNDVYWKTRWEPSQDGTNTAMRTLVCYKDTWAGFALDPVSPTPTWRDPRFGDLGHGPENGLMGTQFQANLVDLPVKVDSNEGKLRIWRNTSLASLPSGTTAALAAHTVGYESDEDVDNGYRPPGLIRMSTSTGPATEYLTDFGNTVVSGTTTHHITLYRAPSGALVFSAGTVQWAWGLDSNHDGLDVQPADPRMRQATLNLLADMGATATTLATGLSPASQSADSVAPTSGITAPTSNQAANVGDMITVKGTASDAGGGIVAAVEVSVDGGATFHAAAGRSSFSYDGVLTGTGPDAIQVRAIDDSGNIQTPTTKLAVNASCPCSIFGALSPTNASVADSAPTTLGTRFVPAADGFISGIRFYKGSANTGAHVGTLYDAAYNTLATVNFGNETTSGWQTATFSTAVPVTAGATYIAAYFAPNGRYAADSYFFSYHAFGSGKLTAPGGNNNPNGVFGNGVNKPTESFKQTNYYVDAIWSSNDSTPLSVSTVSPLADSGSVRTTVSPRATFNRAATAASINFTVVGADNIEAPGTISYDAGTKTATFTPSQGLAPGTRYTAYVNAVATTGGGMAAPYQWSFTTSSAPNPDGLCPCTIFDEDFQPTENPANDSDAVQVGVAFTSATAATVTGIRFFKQAGNGGAHTVSLWDNSGNRMATAPVSTETTTGWQQASFPGPVSIAANSTYIASYFAPVGRYSAEANGLANKITRGPLSTVATGGRYVYGSAGAPLNRSSANYFVDPVVETTPGLPPTVWSTTPGNGARSVPVNAQVKATFNGDIQPGSAVITVKRTSDGAEIAGNLANETTGATATFTPIGSLDAGTKYTVTVSGAKSSTGTAMTSPYTGTFTTAGAAACPCSLMETTTDPTLSDAGDGSAVTLGLKFTSTVDGFIKGLRYYRDASNTGTHIGNLWTADGTRKATLTFTDSGVGWQTANFSAPVKVLAGETYVASYYAPNGHYAAASGYFNNDVVNTPLASVGSGGVYSYSNGFPTESYLNTNYFVDVVFTTADDEPPSVVATSPAADATEVSTTAPAVATFDKDLNPASVAMTVTDSAGQLVSGQFAYDSSTEKVTFTPAEPWAGGATFTASVTADSAAGVTMPSAKTWKFTTTDVEPATVASTTPAAAAVDVPAASPITATFVKAINPSSLVFTLKTSEGATVAGTAAFDAPTRTAQFTPAAALADYTGYTATVTASSPSGVAMTTPKTWSFTTADTIAPIVTAHTPAEGATNVAAGSTVTATFARAIDAGSLSVGVKTAAGATVAGATAYNATTRVATFTPSSALAGATSYTVTVTAVNPSNVAMTTPRTWSFTTADTVAPTVTATTPPAGAANVAASVRPTATFSKAIATSSLTMTLRTAAGVTMNGSVAYNATTRVATFTPSAALTSSTGYTVSVRASSSSGVAMPAPTTWSFTTAAQTFSLYATTRTPSATSTSATPVTVGVQFSSTRAGKVTAIRYYAAATNTGRTVKLYSNTGVAMGTATTTQTNAGWRTATFTTSISISANTTYVASYFAPIGRYSTTTSGYLSSYTAAPLSVPSNGGRISNGDTFPAAGSTTNFWVDVLLLV